MEKLMADSQPYPGAPRWVKVLGIIVLIAVVQFVILHLIGGDFAHPIDHTIGGHTSSPSS
jgi:hypothetical protein